jgi:hypothetical protein
MPSFEISLCNLGVLRVSVVTILARTTEAQKTPRWHREQFQTAAPQEGRCRIGFPAAAVRGLFKSNLIKVTIRWANRETATLDSEAIL